MNGTKPNLVGRNYVKKWTHKKIWGLSREWCFIRQTFLSVYMSPVRLTPPNRKNRRFWHRGGLTDWGEWISKSRSAKMPQFKRKCRQVDHKSVTPLLCVSVWHVLKIGSQWSKLDHSPQFSWEASCVTSAKTVVSSTSHRSKLGMINNNICASANHCIHWRC